MLWVRFSTYPLLVNLLVFSVAGLVVWFVGVRLSTYTCIFLLGLLERRNRTVLGMGVDSLAVLITYIVGLGGLYHVRNQPGF